MPPVLPHAPRRPNPEATARQAPVSPSTSPPAAASGSPTRPGGPVDADEQSLLQLRPLYDQEAREQPTTRPRPSLPPRPPSSAALDDDDERTLASPAEPASTSALASRNKPTTLSGLVKRRRKRLPVEVKPLQAPSSVNASSWMRYLPDEAKLDELYLPGTHDSLALFYPLLSSICQSTPILAQLRGGIRFLDFRFSLLDDGELWAYHGVVPQRLKAEDAFEQVYRWLEGEGRSECVVVSCKQVRQLVLVVCAAVERARLDGAPMTQ
ncbi:hypothetical protein JCM9279_000919 [Rhodotorula babjevae]